MMELICPKCKEKKSSYAMSVEFDDFTGKRTITCIACYTGSSEMEEYYLKVQNSFFEVADDLWERMLK